MVSTNFSVDSPVDYFAFGSNMTTHRLSQRVGSVIILGVAELTRHTLSFAKRSQDGSGKCTVLPHESNSVYGVIFRLNLQQGLILDRFEGVEGREYARLNGEVQFNNVPYPVMYYRAELDHLDEGAAPYDWYHAFVLEGARKHQLPKDYIKDIEGIETLIDHDERRRRSNLAIIKGNYSPI